MRAISATGISVLRAVIWLWVGWMVAAAVGRYTPLHLQGDVLKVSAHLCAQNEGLREVRVARRLVDPGYTFVCRNGAHFLDVIIHMAPEVVEAPVRSGEVLGAK